MVREKPAKKTVKKKSVAIGGSSISERKERHKLKESNSEKMYLFFKLSVVEYIAP